MAQSTPGGRDSNSTEDVDPHSHQSQTKLMEVAGKELDNQQAVCNVEAHVLAYERESSHDSAKRGVATSNPIASTEPAAERVMDKGKEKVDEKMKEPVFIGGVELVDLDDCDVTDRKLQCDSIDSDDDESPNADGVGVRDGPGLCSKTMDSSDEPVARSVAPEVGEHSEPHTTPTAFIDDALFNAAGKAPHPDAMIVKQEAGWFQLRAEKRQRKTAEKLAAQQEKERLVKEVEDSRNQVSLLKQLFERQYGGNIQALLAGNVQVPGTHPPAGTPAPTVIGVPSLAFVFPHGVSGSQPPPLVPDETMYGPSIPDNLSYPRVEDTYEMSSVKFLSPMETDPPIFLVSALPANPSPIVGRVLGFDSMDDAAPL
jgi:hypothetical protein